MNHQQVLDQWAEVLKMIEAARPTTDHPEAHQCLDALKLLADEHSAIVVDHREAAKK